MKLCSQEPVKIGPPHDYFRYATAAEAKEAGEEKALPDATRFAALSDEPLLYCVFAPHRSSGVAGEDEKGNKCHPAKAANYFGGGLAKIPAHASTSQWKLVVEEEERVQALWRRCFQIENKAECEREEACVMSWVEPQVCIPSPFRICADVPRYFAFLDKRTLKARGQSDLCTEKTKLFDGHVQACRRRSDGLCVLLDGPPRRTQEHSSFLSAKVENAKVEHEENHPEQHDAGEHEGQAELAEQAEQESEGKTKREKVRELIKKCGEFKEQGPCDRNTDCKFLVP